MLLDAVSGYKTYITAAFMAGVFFLEQLGLIDHEQGTKLVEAAGIAALIFLRQAVMKSGPAQP